MSDTLIPELEIISGAKFSDGFFTRINPGSDFDRAYRFSLWRIWDKSLPYLAIIGLNPSKANEIDNDNTITRCINFARAWGYGGLKMVNLFGIVETNPKYMKSAIWPVGEGNTKEILEVCTHGNCGLVVAAWGLDGAHRGRDLVVMQALQDAGVKVWCFRVTKDGFPEHPLYIPNDTKIKRYYGRPA